MPVPKHFCWTRFGSEAGEAFGDILSRKEEERVLNRGMFLWGIGNAIGPSVRELIRRERDPQVIFSPIRSAPRAVDTSPKTIVVWTWGETLAGEPYPLPNHSVVTSRFDESAARKSHYALVCSSPLPLRLSEEGDKLLFGLLRNLVSGRPVGASQVTAVVSRLARQHGKANLGPEYQVSIRASLVYRISFGCGAQ